MDERASAVGISMAGFHMGNVVGLLLTPLMLSSIGISGPFILFASLGLLWVSTWSSGVTNNPQDSPFITRSELRLIQAGKPVQPSTNSPKPNPSLRLLLSKLPTWAIIFANVTNNWVSLSLIVSLSEQYLIFCCHKLTRFSLVVVHRDTLFFSHGCLFTSRRYIGIIPCFHSDIYELQENI